MSFVETVRSSLVWKFLLKLQKALLVLSSCFVVLIMCVAVLLRYVFKTDLFGIEEIVVIAAFWLYFIGSSYGVYDKSHVKADIIPQMLSARAQAFLSVMVNLTIAALCDGLDVTKGSFYHHFTSMDGFARELLQYWEADGSARLLAALDGVDDPVERISVLKELGITTNHDAESAIR
ncbi:MAG TPA: TRAP transporter small permease subunit, partial [Aminobacteriaceae bacterium]|nr:TRAP transporter small permease subunit [Aminobacteriaceae bacterium]